jgi:hypothetical protein
VELHAKKLVGNGTAPVKIATALVSSLLLLAMSGCSADAGNAGEDAGQEASETMTVAGTLSLYLYRDVWMDGSKRNCYGSSDSGYADLRAGAQVTVYDSQGAKIALGELGPGQRSGDWHTCTFEFSIEDVPAEGNVFGVEVSQRGQVNFNKDQSESLSLSIGD